MTRAAFVQESEWTGWVLCDEDNESHVVVELVGECLKTRCPECAYKLDFRP